MVATLQALQHGPTLPTPQQDKTYAGVATSAGPLSGWVRLSTSQQLDELCLYLLIWGEAANLRFMPELLHTIFELARTHEAANQAASGAFLRLVVQPVYQTIVKACTAKARTGHSYDTENYDDWNEAFWRRQRGLSDLCTADGIGIFAQPPPDRWACLLRADWERFLLTKTRKTHREMRWWSCLLAANRRVFLLHIITFVCAAAWTMPSIEASRSPMIHNRHITAAPGAHGRYARHRKPALPPALSRVPATQPRLLRRLLRRRLGTWADGPCLPSSPYSGCWRQPVLCSVDPLSVGHATRCSRAPDSSARTLRYDRQSPSEIEISRAAKGLPVRMPRPPG